MRADRILCDVQVMQRIENIKVLGYASMKEDSVTAQADCKDRHQPRILRCIEESTDAASGFTPGQQRGSDVTTGVTIPRISPRVGLSLSFKRPASQVGGQREGSKVREHCGSVHPPPNTAVSCPLQPLLSSYDACQPISAATLTSIGMAQAKKRVVR